MRLILVLYLHKVLLVRNKQGRQSQLQFTLMVDATNKDDIYDIVTNGTNGNNRICAHTR